MQIQHFTMTKNQRNHRNAAPGKVMNITRASKKWQESPVKGHNYGFSPFIFPNLEHLERHMFLKFSRQ